MAMQRQLWSGNGLSTELLRDRRTVAKVLDGVPPDGYVNGHRRWHMATAVAAIERWRRGNEADHADWTERPVLLEVICRRLAEWQKRHDRRSAVLTVPDCAALFGVEPETVLTWLRAGMLTFGISIKLYAVLVGWFYFLFRLGQSRKTKPDSSAGKQGC